MTTTVTALTDSTEPDVARRMPGPSWRNGRVAIGMLLVLTATLFGAVLLRSADHTIPVLAAADDLPSGVALTPSDLVVVQVRLGPGQLPDYLRPGAPWVGAELTQPLRAGMLVPTADLVAARDLPAEAVVDIPIDASDAIPGDLQPGDQVRVLATPINGTSPQPASVLLPDAEVHQVVFDNGGLGAAGSVDGVLVGVDPSTLPAIATAIANDKLTIAKLGAGMPAATGSGTLP